MCTWKCWWAEGAAGFVELQGQQALFNKQELTDPFLSVSMVYLQPSGLYVCP